MLEYLRQENLDDNYFGNLKTLTTICLRKSGYQDTGCQSFLENKAKYKQNSRDKNLNFLDD